MQEFRLLIAIGILIGIPIGLVDALLDNIEIADASLAEAASATGATLAGFAFVLFAGQIYEGIAGRVAAEIELGRGRPVELLALLRSMPRGRLVIANLLYVAGTIVGLVLLVVPGVVFFTIYASVITLISLEGRRIGEAFKRSRKLVRGNFWRVLLIVGLAYLVASELDTGLGALAAETVGGSFVADWIVAAIATALLTPIAAATAVLVTLRLIELSRAE